MSVSVTVSGAKLTLVLGDITKQETDAIVNAANSSLMGGGGVDGAIHKAGGRRILEECMKIREEQGGCDTGEAVITTGGNLPARYVIHQASMRLGDRTTDQSLRDSTRAVLNLAEQAPDVRTLAFPAVGTGIAGFDLQRCAEIMLEEVKSHLAGGSKLTDVHFVLFDEAARNVFQRQWEKMG